MTHGAAFKFFLALVLAMGLAACREAEQNRPLVHEPGVYKGKPDTKLDEQQREVLRQRTRRQFD
jgi:hypothetical protein